MGKLTINKMVKLYTLIAFFILAFIERSAGSVPLQGFHIEINKGYVLLIATVGILLLIFLFRTKKFDSVFFCLMLKCLLDLSPVILNRIPASSTYWYYFSMMISMPLIYLIFRQYSGSLSSIINYMTAFGLLLIVQLVYTIVMNGYSYNESAYKVFLRIPFAHSNIIGVILLAILFLRLMSFRDKGTDLIINITYVVGLVLIQSKGVVLFFAIWFVIIQIIKANEKKQYVKILVIILCLLIFVILVLFVDKLQLLLFSMTFSNFDFSVLSSRRVDIWALSILEWLKNPWFGSGLGITEYNLGFEIVSTGVHNIVLDMAVQSGIVGIFLYGFSVVKGFTAVKKSSINVNKKGICIAAIIILAYSMVEVCYFHYAGLFFFWMFMGLLNSNAESNVHE